MPHEPSPGRRGISDKLTLPLRLELGLELAPFAAPQSPVRQRIVTGFRKAAEEYIRNLGIPGGVTISLAQTGSRLIRLLVNDRYRSIGHDAMAGLWPADSSSAARSTQGALSHLREVARQANAPASADGLQTIVSFVTRTAMEILRLHPEDLFGVPHASRLMAQAPLLVDADIVDVVSSLSPEKFVEAVRPALRLRLSAVGHTAILKSIATGLRSDCSPLELAENVIATLPAGGTRVQISQDYMRALGIDAGPVSRGSQTIKARFDDLADTLMASIGIRLPDVIFEPLDTRGRAFRIGVNQDLGRTLTGIAAAERIVDAAPEELHQHAFGAQAWSEPLDRPLSLVPEASESKLREAGFSVHDALGYIILRISDAIKRRADCFLTVESAETELALVEEHFPSLVLELARHVGSAKLAHIFRELLRERVPITDLVCILHHIICFAAVTADTVGKVVIDDRLAVNERFSACQPDGDDQLLQFVRKGLRSRITSEVAAGRRSLPVFLLDPTLESTLLDHLAASRGDPAYKLLSPDEIDAICLSVSRQVEGAAVHGYGAAILTVDGSVRRFVRNLVSDELPDVPVLCESELDLRGPVEVQELKTISLN